jgi:hypothetical protein
MTIICNQCGIEKNINCFHRDKSRKNGYCARCKTCYKHNRENPGEPISIYEDIEINMLEWPVFFSGSFECLEMR